ncbi:TPA: hypothetical protein ACSTJX_000413 [Serratia fonticola]
MFSDCCFNFKNYDVFFHAPLNENSSFLPITVIFAIGLFILKEVVEFIKKHKANNRKVFAMKRLFSRECEKNLWTIKILKRVFDCIKKYDDEGGVLN